MLSNQLMVRVSDEQSEVLRLIASAQGRSRQDVVREAIDQYADRHLAVGMLTRIRARHAAELALYQRLAR